jgi:hypothetical protein
LNRSNVEYPSVSVNIWHCLQDPSRHSLEPMY